MALKPVIGGPGFVQVPAGTDIAAKTHAATSKITPVDADETPLVDSAASFVLKKLTWANLKATLKTYFDTLYGAAVNTNPLTVTTLDASKAGLIVNSAANVACLKIVSLADNSVDATIPCIHGRTDGQLFLIGGPSRGVTIGYGGGGGVDFWQNFQQLLVLGNTLNYTGIQFQTLAGLQIGSGGAVIQKVLTAVATLDFPAALALTPADLTVTVTGAALGDVVDIGVPNASVPAGTAFFAWVSAADTVTVRSLPLIAGDPPSGVFRICVWKF